MILKSKAKNILLEPFIQEDKVASLMFLKTFFPYKERREQVCLKLVEPLVWKLSKKFKLILAHFLSYEIKYPYKFLLFLREKKCSSN